MVGHWPHKPSVPVQLRVPLSSSLSAVGCPGNFSDIFEEDDKARYDL